MNLMMFFFHYFLSLMFCNCQFFLIFTHPNTVISLIFKTFYKWTQTFYNNKALFTWNYAWMNSQFGFSPDGFSEEALEILSWMPHGRYKSVS